MTRWSKLHAVPNLIACPVCNALHDCFCDNDCKKKSKTRYKNLGQILQAEGC